MSKKQPNQIGAQDLNGHFSKEDIEMAMEHMKRCSASVSKCWWGYGVKWTLLPIGGNENQEIHEGKQIKGSFKNKQTQKSHSWASIQRKP